MHPYINGVPLTGQLRSCALSGSGIRSFLARKNNCTLYGIMWWKHGVVGNITSIQWSLEPYTMIVYEGRAVNNLQNKVTDLATRWSEGAYQISV